MSNDDPRAVYETLRRSTAEMLNLDPADLSPADGLKLDLTSLLRLSLDSLQGAALAGREVDLSRLQSCYAMLSKLLPQAVEAPPPQLCEPHAARDKVAKLIEGYRIAFEEDQRAEAERVAAALSEKDAVIAEKDAVIAALTGEVAPKPAVAERPPAAPPEQTTSLPKSNQPPLPPANAAVPRAYLRDGSEPWRSHVDGGRDRWRNNNV